MKYYVRNGDSDPQPIDESEIENLVKGGWADVKTHACAVGAQSWSTLGELLPHLFGGLRPPPKDFVKKESPVANATAFVRDHGVKVASKARTFARRIMASNFMVEAVLPEESAALEKAAIPVKAAVAQNYAAWRQAMLWFSGVGLGIAAVLSFVDDFKNIVTSNALPILRVISFGLLAVKVITPLLLIRAALQWTDIRASRRDARRAVFCTFFGPLLFFLLPVKALSTPDQLVRMDMGPGDPKDMLMLIGSGMAVFALTTLLPHFLGLFPGIVRACLTLRTLVPESPLPGTIIALILPLFSMLLLIGLSIAAQAGTGLIFFGVAGMLCLPFFLFRNIRLLLKPMDGNAMNAQIGPLRKRAGFAWDVGILFVIVDLFWLWRHFSYFDIASFVCELW